MTFSSNYGKQRGSSVWLSCTWKGANQSSKPVKHFSASKKQNNRVGLQFVSSPAISQNLLICNHWRPSCSRFFCQFSTSSSGQMVLMFTQCVDKRPFLCLWHSPAHPVTSSLWYLVVISYYCLHGTRLSRASDVDPSPPMWLSVSCTLPRRRLRETPPCMSPPQPGPHRCLLCHDPLHHFLSVVLPTALLPLAVYKTPLTVTAARSTAEGTFAAPPLPAPP